MEEKQSHVQVQVSSLPISPYEKQILLCPIGIGIGIDIDV